MSSNLRVSSRKIAPRQRSARHLLPKLIFASVTILPTQGCTAFAAGVGYAAMGASAVALGGTLVSEMGRGSTVKQDADRITGFETIHQAVEKGDVELLRMAILRTRAIYEVDSLGETPLTKLLSYRFSRKETFFEMFQTILGEVERLPREQQAEMLNYVNRRNESALDLIVSQNLFREFTEIVKRFPLIIDYSRAIEKIEESREWKSWVSAEKNEINYYCPPEKLEQWWINRDSYFAGITSIRMKVKMHDILIKMQEKVSAESGKSEK